MEDFDLPSLDDDEGFKQQPKNNAPPLGRRAKASTPAPGKQKRDLDYFELEKRKKKQKAAVASGVGVLTLGALVAGLLTFDPFGGKQEKGTAPVGTTQQQQSTAVDVNAAGKDTFDKDGNLVKEFWQSDEGVNYPVKMQDWEIDIAQPLERNTPVNGNIVSAYSKGEFGHSTDRLPGQSSGFTSDDSQQKLKDGTLNPLYSYVTAEDYRFIVGTYIERLINPIYGDWKQAEYSTKYDFHKDAQIDDFSDMFTDGWGQGAVGKKPREVLPIFADWDNNDYGMAGQLLDKGPRWMGKVQSTKTVMKYNDETLQYDSKITVNVKYSAWLKDQTVATKDGVLTLDVVTNTTDDKRPKLLLKNASLQVK